MLNVQTKNMVIICRDSRNQQHHATFSYMKKPQTENIQNIVKLTLSSLNVVENKWKVILQTIQ